MLISPITAAASVAPKDVAYFCLPLGGLLSPLPGSPCKDGTDTETHNGSLGLIHPTANKSHNAKSLSRKSYVRHTCKEYSADCFVFVLDDKTVPADVTRSSSEADAQHPGKRLYGICVQQVRSITVPFSHAADPSSPGTDTDDKEFSDDTQSSMVFESKVCFAFVTHYPFIQFFFQVSHDILAAASASRMIVGNEKENKKDNEKVKVRSSMHTEDYIPRALLDEMLSRLSGLKAPSYGMLT